MSASQTEGNHTYSERDRPEIVVEGRTTETSSVSIALMIMVNKVQDLLTVRETGACMIIDLCLPDVKLLCGTVYMSLLAQW